MLQNKNLVSRRLSLAEESGNIGKIAEILQTKPSDRNTSSIQYILKATEHIKFFSELTAQNNDEGELHRQCCACMTYEKYQPGQEVIQIGTFGDKFYIILSGSVSVQIWNKMEEEQQQENKDTIKQENSTEVSLNKELNVGSVKVIRQHQQIEQINTQPIFSLREIKKNDSPKEIKTVSLSSREIKVPSKFARQQSNVSLPSQNDIKIGDSQKIINNAQLDLSQNHQGKAVEEIKQEEKQKILKTVGHMSTGDSFGELALLSRKPRMATIVCEEESEFFVLSKKDFDKILKNKKILNEKLAFLQSLPFLADLTQEHSREVYSRAEYVSYVANQKVYSEGEESKDVYIVLKGNFKCTKKFYAKSAGENDFSQKRLEDQSISAFKIQDNYDSFKQMKVLSIGVNELFGEEEVINGMKRGSTVSCETVEGELLVIRKNIFLQKVMADTAGASYMKKQLAVKQKQWQQKIMSISQHVDQYWNYLREDRMKLRMDLELREESLSRRKWAESVTDTNQTNDQNQNMQKQVSLQTASPESKKKQLTVNMSAPSSDFIQNKLQRSCSVATSASFFHHPVNKSLNKQLSQQFSLRTMAQPSNNACIPIISEDAEEQKQLICDLSIQYEVSEQQQQQQQQQHQDQNNNLPIPAFPFAYFNHHAQKQPQVQMQIQQKQAASQIPPIQSANQSNGKDALKMISKNGSVKVDPLDEPIIQIPDNYQPYDFRVNQEGIEEISNRKQALKNPYKNYLQDLKRANPPQPSHLLRTRLAKKYRLQSQGAIPDPKTQPNMPEDGNLLNAVLIGGGGNKAVRKVQSTPKSKSSVTSIRDWSQQWAQYNQKDQNQPEEVVHVEDIENSPQNKQIAFNDDITHPLSKNATTASIESQTNPIKSKNPLSRHSQQTNSLVDLNIRKCYSQSQHIPAQSGSLISGDNSPQSKRLIGQISDTYQSKFKKDDDISSYSNKLNIFSQRSRILSSSQQKTRATKNNQTLQRQAASFDNYPGSTSGIHLTQMKKQIGSSTQIQRPGTGSVKPSTFSFAVDQNKQNENTSYQKIFTQERDCLGQPIQSQVINFGEQSQTNSPRKNQQYSTFQQQQVAQNMRMSRQGTPIDKKKLEINNNTSTNSNQNANNNNSITNAFFHSPNANNFVKSAQIKKKRFQEGAGKKNIEINPSLQQQQLFQFLEPSIKAIHNSPTLIYQRTHRHVASMGIIETKQASKINFVQ